MKAYKNVGVSRATSPKRQKKKSNLDVPRCRTNASLLTGKGRAGESRAAPADSTPRRERRDEAAGTRCLSRPRRSDWSRAATGERAGCGRKTGRAVRRGLARDKGGEWAAADASHDSAMAAAVPAGMQAMPG